MPAEPTIGGEIRGVDLSQPLDDATVGAIHDALMDRKVIFFRDQDIAPEQHLAFGRRFGEVSVHPFVPHLERLPEVIVLDNHKDNPVFSTDIWHSDETFREEPPMGSILRCVTIPPVGGDTMWADMCAAHDGLSDRMQSFLSGSKRSTTSRISATNSTTWISGTACEARRDGDRAPQPGSSVIRTHPVTGRKAVFVNEQFTIAIKGMRKDESKALLEFLFTLPRIPEYQFRFRWEPHSIVFWDNPSTQHYAANDYYPVRRTMQRVTIRGARPF